MRALTASDLDEIEQRLRARRIDLLDTVRSCLGAVGSDKGRGLGRLQAGGDDVVGKLTASETALLSGELGELRAIDAALERIDFGVGGLCTLCRMPLPMSLLRLTPTAALCAACAKQQDE